MGFSELVGSPEGEFNYLFRLNREYITTLFIIKYIRKLVGSQLKKEKILIKQF